MQPVFEFKGIYTPVVTPHLSGGTINWGASENFARSVEERIAIAQFSHERIKGRLPLIVGTGAMLTSDSIALTKAESSKQTRSFWPPRQITCV